MSIQYNKLPSFRSEDGRVWFRPVNDDDIDFIVRIRNSPFVKEKFVYREDFTHESQKRWMDENVYTGRVVDYIFGVGDDRVGCVYLTPVNDGTGRAEYGIFSDEAFAGHGLGTIACREISELALKLGFSGCVARLIAGNAASQKMQERCGYFEKGRFTEKSSPDGEELCMILMEYAPKTTD